MTAPASIVQLIGSFQGGGAQRLALNLAEALAAKGHRSIAVALRHAGAFADKDRPAGVEVHALNASRESRASVLRAARGLRRLLRASNAAVVHVHGSGCIVVAAMALLGWRDRPRLVFTWHDSGSVVGGRGLKRALTLWALRRCDALYGSSQGVADRLSAAVGPRRGGAALASVFVNAVPDRPLTAAIDDPVARLLWMGRLVPVKDPELMLRALARVNTMVTAGSGSEWGGSGEPRARAGGAATASASDVATERAGFECILAGAALPHGIAFETLCRNLHASLGLGGCVSMPGWVDDTAGLMARSNVGVQSSRSEGLSMALLEQMMAGLAVVATDVGDTSRAVIHESTGLLVPPGDEGALADAMGRLVADASLRRRLGLAGRERARAEFSLRAMADRAVVAYRSVGATI